MYTHAKQQYLAELVELAEFRAQPSTFAKLMAEVGNHRERLIVVRRREHLPTRRRAGGSEHPVSSHTGRVDGPGGSQTLQGAPTWDRRPAQWSY